MSKDPLVYIRHIQDCVVQIMEYTSGMNQEDFLNNRLVQDAVENIIPELHSATQKILNN